MVGEYLSLKVNDAGWGRAVVRQLADHIRKTDSDSKGFSVQNLWRMKQFYETYREREKLSPLVRELPWSHNLLILGNLSPALVSEYQTRLPDKNMLRQKLHEFYELAYRPLADQEIRGEENDDK